MAMVITLLVSGCAPKPVVIHSDKEIAYLQNIDIQDTSCLSRSEKEKLVLNKCIIIIHQAKNGLYYKDRLDRKTQESLLQSCKKLVASLQ